MLRITIEAATGEELRVKLADIAGAFTGHVVGSNDARQLNLPLAGPGTQPDLAEPLRVAGGSEEAKAKRGRKSNEEKERERVAAATAVAAAMVVAATPAPAPTPAPIDPFAEETAAPAPTTPTVFTFDQVKAALKEVNDKNGLPAVQKILNEVKAARVSAIAEADYPKTIEACSFALKG